MDRVVSVVLLVLIAAITPVRAQQPGSARDLANDCQTVLHGKKGRGSEIRIPFTKQALVCWGYMQAIQDFSVLADTEGRRALGACPPENTTLVQLIRTFVKYVRSHRDLLPQNAALAVTQALQQAYPCGPDRVRGSGLPGGGV